MKILSKLIFSFLSIFMLSGFVFAQVNVPSQTFNLGTNVDGVWDQGAQTLTIQPRWAGTGKIDRNTWIQLKVTLGLEQTALNKIEFKSGVQFPDDASLFFKDFKSEIIFPLDQDTSNVTNMAWMFRWATNFNQSIGNWKTDNVTNMNSMFWDAVKFNSDLSNWNVSKVTNMYSMFWNTPEFNSDLSGWDTKNVVNMEYLFWKAWKFNSDLSRWNTAKVTTMKWMFQDATSFNHPLNNWDTSRVIDMKWMFYNASSFNQPLNDWNTSNVTHMNQMFLGATSFNQPLNDWNTSNVTDMSQMFQGATSFNHPLNDWDTSNVTDMSQMFQGATSFNHPLNSWDTKNVVNMWWMFHGAKNFSSDLSSWNTERVTNMREMFYDAHEFHWDVSTWNVSKVTNMYSMFWNAKKFNSDLSNWDFSSVTNAQWFISSYSWDMSYSTANHDSLLQKLENDYLAGRLLPTKIGQIYVRAKYCLSAPLVHRLETYWFNIVYNEFDCKPEFTFVQPTLQSSGEIMDTRFTFKSLYPLTQADLDAGVFSIDSAQTTVDHSPLDCKLDDSDDKVAHCTVKITSTHESPNGKIWIKFLKMVEWGREIKSSIQATGYLIDTQAPKLAQLKIDTNNGTEIDKPTIFLSKLPDDQWAAGTKYCEVLYTDSHWKAKTITPFPINSAGEKIELVPWEEVHTLKVKCYDTVGNYSISTIKFPPIIEFSDENITLSNTEMIWSFTVYSPSKKPITKIEIEDPDWTQVQLWTCTSQEDNGTNSPWTNSKDKPVICTFTRVTKSWTVIIKATDNTWAEGQNGQSFTKDTTKPKIDIQPEQILTWGKIPFIITITDDQGIDKDAVLIDSSTLDHDGFVCNQESNTFVKCTFTATKPTTNWQLKITAVDRAGNQQSKEQWNYIIDQSAPEVNNIKLNFTPDRSKIEVSFITQDEWWAGLDLNRISYGVGSDNNCSDYAPVYSLIPLAWTNEPFHFKFNFSDSSQNGKYLCASISDKVGKVQLIALDSTPLTINIAPEVDWASFQVDEHHQDKPISVKTIGDIIARDANGDTMTYTIFSGNDDGIFTFDGNTLKTVAGKALDFETKPVHTLIVRVTDQYGLTGDAKVVVTLRDLDENPPQINTIPNQRIKKNRPVQISIDAKDDVGVKGIEISGLPKGLVYNPTTKKIEGSTSDAVRDRTITVKVVDNQGNVAVKTFTLTVVGSRHDDTSGGGKTCYGDCWTNPVSPDNGPSVQPTPQPDQKPQTNPNDNKKPDQKPVEKTEWKLIKHEDTAIFNSTVENGKCYTRREYLGIKDSETLVTSEEFKKALSFLRSYEMTMFDNVEGFDPYRNLSREEAAKIFSNFAINVLCRKPDMNLSVKYSDVENADPSLKPYITLAYQLGVMKGSGMGDGEFRPFDAISKAEVNAVLIRMILKSYLDENKSENKVWYAEYNKVATDLGIINQGAGAEPVLRNNVALMLFRAYKNQVFDWRNVDYFSYVLKSRDLFVK